MMFLLATALPRFSLNRAQVVLGKFRPEYHAFQEWLQSIHHDPHESRVGVIVRSYGSSLPKQCATALNRCEAVAKLLYH